VYWFTDADGRPLFAKLRYETPSRIGGITGDKTFRYGWLESRFGWLEGEGRWRREKPSGKRGGPDADAWLYGLQTLERPGLVYWTEGEKDAETLHARGLAAVSHHGGAGKVFAEMAEPLVGRTVVVCGDHDIPGYHDALLRVQLLEEWGITVRVRFPREGKDVTDHVVAGIPVERLRRMPRARLREWASQYTEAAGRALGYEK
jgi:hypothetical protein